jgi:hypothetical protein
MKYVAAALCTFPLLAGCADISKFIPAASAKFNTDLQAEKTLAAQLATDFRTEDRTLRFLSAEGLLLERGYSCGDPKDPRLKRLPSLAKKTVKKDNANLSKALQYALATLQQYSDSLTKIQKRDTDAKAALKTLNSLIDTASKIPGAPNYSAAADAGLPIANALVDLFSVEALVELAREMQGHLGRPLES